MRSRKNTCAHASHCISCLFSESPRHRNVAALNSGLDVLSGLSDHPPNGATVEAEARSRPLSQRMAFRLALSDSSNRPSLSNAMRALAYAFG